MKLLRYGLVLSFAFLLAGCTRLGFAAVNLPPVKDIAVQRDIAFAPASYGRLDIYQPTRIT